MTSPLPPLVAALEGTLIVSCQAYPGEPMRDPRTMAQVAAAVAAGGASAVRAQGLEDIRHVKHAVDVPVIGIWKDGEDGVFITPTLDHALAVIDAGADILALDATDRPRPDGRTRYGPVICPTKNTAGCSRSVPSAPTSTNGSPSVKINSELPSGNAGSPSPWVPSPVSPASASGSSRRNQ